MLIVLRLHAGVSTIDPQPWAAIPFSAFTDAIEEYEADSETDDKGDMVGECLKSFFPPLFCFKNIVSM